MNQRRRGIATFIIRRFLAFLHRNGYYIRGRKEGEVFSSAADDDDLLAGFWRDELNE